MVQRIARKNEDSFERNWRRKFERRMHPVADNLYWEIIPGIKDILRGYRLRTALPLIVELGPLDKELGIDVIFTLDNGMRLTCQEKFNQHTFSYKKNATVEYENDPIRGKPGDWFTMITQLYFFGFASKDEKSFDLWVLFDWPRTVWRTVKGNIPWELKPQPEYRAEDGAMASFVRTFIPHLPKSCILATNFRETTL
ncbi:unnamed protein product [marine sediment metagenome]|uniref:Uncharacterized protein n=1 Tax=marine sediment metagenome TaxID=412755 RepID=X1QEV0_9ZZZZ